MLIQEGFWKELIMVMKIVMGENNVIVFNRGGIANL
tara:strand:+ start:1100 stop:1207 length:108 start_codon:yes stop_codon:yes gene_type:complete